MKLSVRAFSLLIAAFLSLPAAWAQFETAAVLGNVHDASGGEIAGAHVRLVNDATGVSLEAISGSQGEYTFPDVHLGRYHLETDAPGFNPVHSQPFTLTVNARQRVDLSLQPGAVTQNVTVSGEASSLETDTSERGQVIASQVVRDLPLNGRAYADLALLSTGVRRNNLENQSTSSRDASFNVNGQRSEFNNFLLDGLDNNAYGTSNQGFSNQSIPPSPDAINEFRVETNNYSAEYGRSPGAVINVSINSGTNQFHGRAWDYLRNTVLNAIGPFSAPTNPLTGKSQKPVLIRNQFGGALGGPIFKDKTFFFADYEGERQITHTYTTATVPTALQRQGVFVDANGAPVPLKNPITGAIYANGIVPQTAWSSFATGVINALPAPNVNGFASNYVSLPAGTLQDDKGDIRVDQNFRRAAIFVRYSKHNGYIFDPPNITGPAGGNSNANAHILNQQLAAGLTYTLNANAIIDGRVGFTWTEGGKTPYGLGGAETLMGGISGLPTDPSVVRNLNPQSVSGFSAFGTQGTNPQFQNPFVFNPKLNISLVRGHHTLKFGYEYQSIDTSVDDFNPVYGADSYSGQFSANGGNSKVTGVTQANNLADFLVGARNNYQLNNFAVVDYNQRMNFWYAQDDWRALPNLTINAGLRYELVTPQWVTGERLSNFDPSTNTLIQAKPGSLYDRALVHMPLLDFAPRVGFAYSIDPKTVIRAGYFLGYNQFNREGGENLLAYNGPFILNGTINQKPSSAPCTGDSFTNCFRTTQQGYPTGLISPANFNTLNVQSRYIPKDTPTGYIQTWQLDVQRQIAPDTIFDIAYVGTHGVKLQVLGDYNQAAPNQQTATCTLAGGTFVKTGCLSEQARRPITNFAGIEVSLPAGFLSYNALQMKVEHRYAQGLYFLDSFTYSRAIDNASGHLDTPNGDNSRVNLANLDRERGPSAYNQKFNNTSTVIWDLPYGRGRRFGASAPAALDEALGGWQLTFINFLTSGQPVNLTYTIDPSVTVSDLLTYRPNVSGSPNTKEGTRVKTATSVQNFLSATNVTLPTDVNSPYGNAGRNSALTYPFYQLDAAVHKRFALRPERLALDFRAEAFNVLNQVNYTAPDSNRSNSTFGTITSNFPARQLQFALKLVY